MVSNDNTASDGQFPASELPAEFAAAVRQLNSGEYYACHETLEALWLAERGPLRELYQGVLQIAVGCYHLTVRANWIGATRKLDEGTQRLERAGLAGTRCYGVDWSAFIAAADRLRDTLRQLGPERVGEFDAALLPQIENQGGIADARGQ